MVDLISNPDETKEFLPRFRIFYFVFLLVFITFSARLWFLQIYQGKELREFSEKNRIKQIKNMAPRGIMFDRENRVLVENHPGFSATLSLQYVSKLDEVVQRIAPILDHDPQKLRQRVERHKKQNGPFAPIRLKDNLTKDEVFRLKRIRLETPGLDIRENVVRYYPLSENGAQLFGYVSEISKKQIPLYNEIYKDDYVFEQGDIIGKNGLEELLERELRGQDGIQFLQVDALGREAVTQTPNIYGEQIKDLSPVPGNDIILTLDRTLQEVAWKKFSSAQRIGGVVAMKSNGEVLAWISSPSFDPNEIARGISSKAWSQIINDPFKPLRNKVIQDYSPPGSTFKAFMALTALEEKVITPTTIINCPGTIRFGRREYHDHIKGGHGNITIYDALERSSNVFFYKMGIALGIDNIYSHISPFGLGRKTGIELKNEASGLLPSAEWKKSVIGEEWQPGENLSTAIGQGFVQVTPLQLAVAYNAIGLEGKVVKPFLISKIISQDGKVLKETQPQIVRDISSPTDEVKAIESKNEQSEHISKEVFQIVKEGLRRVVNGPRGTARSVHLPEVVIAGKTGTTQVMGFAATDIYTLCENRPLFQRHHGWFVAYAPADHPEIVVAALAEHSCHGGSGAGPVVKEVMRAYFEKYHPELFKNKKEKKNASQPSLLPEVEEPSIEGE